MVSARARARGGVRVGQGSGNDPVTISPSNVASTVCCHPAKESLPPVSSNVLFKAVLKVILDVFSWSLEKCTVSVRCVRGTFYVTRRTMQETYRTVFTILRYANG